MKDEFFDSNPTWKTRKYRVCEEPGMRLWMWIQCMKRTGLCSLNKSIPIEPFPYPLTTDCKCKNCRYTRWRRSKS